MTATELQKQRFNSKKLAVAMANPHPSAWRRQIQFISDVRWHIKLNPTDKCIIACKDKEKTEQLLIEYGITNEHFELIGFDEMEKVQK